MKHSTACSYIVYMIYFKYIVKMNYLTPAVNPVDLKLGDSDQTTGGSFLGIPHWNPLTDHSK